ncbi:beta/gamma crystallin [Sinobacterium caligoides]|uniref:Beta/gamma crystallin n=1 Tax=Sinobacterium caligoides TaxID=933926 RepID=A0A3N2DJF4_9GAMM|nr:beta/gamma crystallin-related protein [Sinobacterium caligoides]ROR99933.1 beta/gamma crystallin [Sinobacterium caligoides]
MKKILCLAMMLGCAASVQASSNHNDETIYICTMSAFSDTFADAGRTEQEARDKVVERCKTKRNEMFCQPKDSHCFTSTLAGNGNNNNHHNKGSLVLYSHKNQKGHSVTINKDQANFFKQDFNDKMVSFHVPKGWKVRFYEDINFTGKSYTYKGGNDNADGFEHSVSSVKIIHTR